MTPGIYPIPNISFRLIWPAERNGVLFKPILMHLWAQIERTVLGRGASQGRGDVGWGRGDVGCLGGR